MPTFMRNCVGCNQVSTLRLSTPAAQHDLLYPKGARLEGLLADAQAAL